MQRSTPDCRTAAPASATECDGASCRVWGSKSAPTTKVSESLDYESPQNRLFYERMNAKGGKKKLYGYVYHNTASTPCSSPHGFSWLPNRTCRRPRMAASSLPPGCPSGPAEDHAWRLPCLLDPYPSGLPHACSMTSPGSGPGSLLRTNRAWHLAPACLLRLGPRGAAENCACLPRAEKRACLPPAENCACSPPLRYTGHTLAKFIVTFFIGVITGCFAVALSKCKSKAVTGS